MALIPERLVNCKVYAGPKATEFLGLATVDLPNFDALTETIMGAGIAGEIDSPVLGHFKSMTVKCSFRAPTKSMLDMLAPIEQRFDIRGSIQLKESGLGAVVTQAFEVECRGPIKSTPLGKLEAGKVIGSELDMEVVFIRVKLNGVVLVELDKFNQVFRVSGVDYLTEVRRNLGGV